MFNVQWLADTIKGNIDKLITIGFFVQGIVTNKHEANANGFSELVRILNSKLK